MAKDKSCLYGVMWLKDETWQRWHYLLGIETNTPQGDMAYVEIPHGYFAVATVPKEILSSEAWTEFYSKEIPAKGFIPDENYGIYFEFFDETGNYELWTAVTQQQ